MLGNPASIFDSVLIITLPMFALKANQSVELLEVTPGVMHMFAQTQCIAHDCSLIRRVGKTLLTSIYLKQVSAAASEPSMG